MMFSRRANEAGGSPFGSVFDLGATRSHLFESPWLQDPASRRPAMPKPTPALMVVAPVILVVLSLSNPAVIRICSLFLARFGTCIIEGRTKATGEFQTMFVLCFLPPLSSRTRLAWL